MNIHNNLKSTRIPLALIPISLGGLFLYQCLTFTPEYASATTTIETTTPPKTLEDITYMSELTPEICGNTKTPSAFLSDGVTINPNVPTKRLIDDREGINGTKYWVAKLADGNCWMTQNMTYSNISHTATGGYADSFYSGKRNTLLIPHIDNNLISYTQKTVSGGMEPSDDPTLSFVENNVIYDAHYLIGNYYMMEEYPNSQANSTCNFSSKNSQANWQLPTSPSEADRNSENGSFSKLLGIYNITDDMSGNIALSQAPFYFLPTGFYFAEFSQEPLTGLGTNGTYWSSTPNHSSHYFTYYGLSTSTQNTGRATAQGAQRPLYGSPTRCVTVADHSEIPSNLPPSNPTLSITIPKVLTLDVTDSVNIETNPNNISTGTFTATVTSNSSYNIALSTITNGHTDLINDKTPTASIPALSSTITTSNNKWWGIKCTNTTNTNCTKPNYTGLTITPEIYYSSSTSTSSTPTTFNIGIQTSPDLPSGTYSTSILVTASQN